MRAIYLVKKGPADQAFEIREIAKPEPAPGEVQIQVEAFGLNFADVMARLGLYPDAPPMPAVLGYDVVGEISALGEGVETFKIGDRVTAMTRFGGYAEYAVTDARALAKISDSMDAGIANALTTQYGTAYYMAESLIRLNPGEHVLIHAAAGGVGTALVQLARYRQCVIYGTAGSAEKLEYLRQLGVDHPINYREQDFAEEIRSLRGESGLDVVFDPVGGSSLKKGFKLLAAGGRIISFGASTMTQAKNIFSKIRVGLGFGIYHPVSFISKSRSMLGVNMLKLADQRPEALMRVLEGVVGMTEKGILQPHVGGVFPAEQIAQAHAFLESRQSMGKVVLTW